MELAYHGYNAFVARTGDAEIAIDPGGSLYFFTFLKSLIPKNEWRNITHVLVTHGDPDHHWYTDRVARKSGAPIICNENMIKEEDGKLLMNHPRTRSISYMHVDNLNPLAVGETIEVAGVTVTGIQVVHGPLQIKLGPFKKTLVPGPGERIGIGQMGFEIHVNGRSLVNLGDTLLLEEEWTSIKHPDVLMIPIGGLNTMDVNDAAVAVDAMRPEIVVPCHYDCPGLFSKKYNRVETATFKAHVEESGARCLLMEPGDRVTL